MKQEASISGINSLLGGLQEALIDCQFEIINANAFMIQVEGETEPSAYLIQAFPRMNEGTNYLNLSAKISVPEDIASDNLLKLVTYQNSATRGISWSYDEGDEEEGIPPYLMLTTGFILEKGLDADVDAFISEFGILRTELDRALEILSEVGGDQIQSGHLSPKAEGAKLRIVQSDHAVFNGSAEAIFHDLLKHMGTLYDCQISDTDQELCKILRIKDHADEIYIKTLPHGLLSIMSPLRLKAETEMELMQIANQANLNSEIGFIELIPDGHGLCYVNTLRLVDGLSPKQLTSFVQSAVSVHGLKFLREFS